MKCDLSNLYHITLLITATLLPTGGGLAGTDGRGSGKVLERGSFMGLFSTRPSPTQQLIYSTNCRIISQHNKLDVHMSTEVSVVILQQSSAACTKHVNQQICRV